MLFDVCMRNVFENETTCFFRQWMLCGWMNNTFFWHSPKPNKVYIKLSKDPRCDIEPTYLDGKTELEKGHKCLDCVFPGA